tara:strand:- start:13490 stop:14182 length:693 start_codon:yes stop_codon:yes gene_type:complete
MNQLRGFTYSPQYSMTMIEWLEERARRKKNRSNAEKKEGESFEAFEARVESMPKPRSWSDYMLDPNDNGVTLLDDPTEDEQARYFGLDPNNDVNKDSLLLQPWWDTRITSGRDEEAISLYKGYIRDAEIGPFTKAAELASPSIFIATGAGDTVPSSFNLFQTEEGGRLEAHKQDKQYKRVFTNMIQAPFGWLMIGAGVVGASIVFAKVVPNFVKSLTESVDEGIVEPLRD